ncbi:hypothetical protein [Paucibacter sp. KCTC 42545]|uniref:hypothetical protein n=1 Tax=Paucibacter sp. KCTC 42545 TaxID=1768242 RepID=UPI0012E3AF2E|nr:hypothetical protein [Paucibacter sp. KCTC 42545]
MDPFPATRTLAVLCAFSRCDIPTRETRRHLPALERVEPTLNRLHVLLSSYQFSAAGVQVVELLNLGKTELLEQLDLVRDAVEARSNVNMVVFWSGHGNVQEQALRNSQCS